MPMLIVRGLEEDTSNYSCLYCLEWLAVCSDALHCQALQRTDEVDVIL